MILLSELSRRRIRSIQKLIRVGRNEVVVVLRVDREKGTYTLQISVALIQPPSESMDRLHRSLKTPRFARRYHQMRGTVHEIQSRRLHHATRCIKSTRCTCSRGRRCGSGRSSHRRVERRSAAGEAVRAGCLAARKNLRTSVRCIQAGPHVSPTLRSCNAVRQHLLIHPCSEQDTVFSSLANPPSPAAIAALTSTIARRLTPQPIKLRADIELTCYTPAGIDAIKRALRAGEKESNETVPIKAKLVAPPLYVLSTNATDKVRILQPMGDETSNALHPPPVCRS